MLWVGTPPPIIFEHCTEGQSPVKEYISYLDIIVMGMVLKVVGSVPKK